jgi:hypothetical protein
MKYLESKRLGDQVEYSGTQVEEEGGRATAKGEGAVNVFLSIDNVSQQGGILLPHQAMPERLLQIHLPDLCKSIPSPPQVDFLK